MNSNLCTALPLPLPNPENPEQPLSEEQAVKVPINLSGSNLQPFFEPARQPSPCRPLTSITPSRRF